MGNVKNTGKSVEADTNNSEELENYNEAFNVYDNEVAYMYRQNVTVLSIKNEIRSTHGPISLGEIYQSLRRQGVTPNRRQRSERSDVVNFGQSGIGLEEIVKLTGYSKRQVSNILKASKQDARLTD